MKTLENLEVIYNGQKMKITSYNQICIQDQNGSQHYVNANQLEVATPDGGSGNMDIVRMYIDDLRHLSNLKSNNG